MAERKPLHQFVLPTGRYRAEQLVDGVLVNPVLPKKFENTSNETRPQSHQKWWGVPFIVSSSIESLDAFYDGRDDEFADEARRDWHGRGREQWLSAYLTGSCFNVRCLDGGAWDRSTNWGARATLAEAVSLAKSGPTYQRREKTDAADH